MQKGERFCDDTYQQYEEHKEYERDEVNRSKDPVCCFYGFKIKISQHNTELCEAGSKKYKREVGWLLPKQSTVRVS